ncbi:uncharacterized protein LOC119684664 [Teleopsis dalmanni]|uniref:uncharacterized protein LOC119684664 n=1 Tax=Teleopsis dalmanni TaxID=139649 RepID=UPI0018CD3E9D|nr:uncharacterized protein LOC119684664 [Teleopsis dalmanni]
MIYFKFLVILTLTVTTSLAEQILSKAAPYPAAGWRPKKPFNLPGEYLPAREVESQNQLPQVADVEITQERIDFAGQIQDNISPDLNHQPHSNYAPPRQSDRTPFNTQALPNDRDTVFKNDKDIFPNGPIQPQIQLQEEQKQFFPEDERQEITNPAPQYGVPDIVQQNSAFPDPRNSLTATNADEENPAAIEALNAAVEAYNRERDSQYVSSQSGSDATDFSPQTPSKTVVPRRFSKGQYFVLGPDNNVQRVMFTTTQDDEERRSNGFTAQLKYTPVGAVKDPVYRYNNRGQLIRLF